MNLATCHSKRDYCTTTDIERIKLFNLQPRSRKSNPMASGLLPKLPVLADTYTQLCFYVNIEKQNLKEFNQLKEQNDISIK